MIKKTTIINVLLAFFSVAVVFIFLELMTRHSSISDNLGWNRNISVANRVELYEKRNDHIILMGLGDSFSDYRDIDGGNYLRFAEKKINSDGHKVQLVNLSEAGTGLISYRRNFSKYKDIVSPDIVMVGVYLGNDIANYCAEKTSNVSAVNEHYSMGRLKKIVKKNSILLNYIFRVMKQYFPSFQTGNYNYNLEITKHSYEVNDEVIKDRESKIDQRYIEMSRSDAINPWIIPHALAYPSYFYDLYMRPKIFRPLEIKSIDYDRIIHEDSLSCTLNYIDRFANEIKDFGATPIIVLIPDSMVVSDKYQLFWRDVGFDNISKIPVTSDIPLVSEISSFLGSKGHAYINLMPLLRSEHEGIYIPMDMHFNTHGQRISGKFIYKYIMDNDILK
jgi:hypothetical protein